MKNWLRTAAIALIALAPARADQITFTGVCSDCRGNAIATLTVTGFDPAVPFTLTLSDFVSFSYAGTNLLAPFVLDHSNVISVSGTLGTTYPHPYDVFIEAAVGTPSFASSIEGVWALSSGQGLD